MSGIKAAQDASSVLTKEDGTRVIAASKRPDGTVRKERRVRAGYVPQDEQPIYESKGKQMTKGPNHPPGFFPDDEIKKAPVSKSAKKNAARKAKKAAGEDGDAAAADIAKMSLAAPAAPSSAAPPPQAGGAGPTAGGDVGEDGPAALEKKVRNLKKKIRQCDTIQEKRDAGKALTAEEEAKLGNKPGWEAEVRQLEAQLTAA
eukprot:jgi/Tetstr1/424837/TSEL_015340.t1